MSSETKLQRLDSALLAAADGIRVLEALAWPPETEEIFLEGWRKGRAELPEPGVLPRDGAATIAKLESVAADCDDF